MRNDACCQLRIGVMFYFYEDPASYKREIIEMFEEYCSLTQEKFTLYRYNKDMGYSILKRENQEFFNSLIEKCDFESTQHLILTNAKKDEVQTIRFEMIMRNLDPNFKIKLPNYMYFEFLPTIDYGEIFHFIRQAFWGMPYHYCCCNLLMGANDYLEDKGRQSAVKRACEEKCLSDYYSVFQNMSRHFEMKNKIDGPNMIQVLSKKLYDEVGLLKIIDECETNDIYHEMGEDYIMIAISEEELPSGDTYFRQYQILYQILKDIILDMRKPDMYWKAEKWNQWRNRFDENEEKDVKENIGIKIKDKDKMAICVKIIRKYTNEPISDIKGKIENDEYVLEGNYLEEDDIIKILKIYKELQQNGIAVELYDELDRVTSPELLNNLLNSYSEISYRIEKRVDMELGESI